MRLIGLLDSPYVRRVAISLKLLRLPFEHLPLSVFRNFEAFHAINPVVKAPTLVCADGTVLMDSNVILDYVQALARRSLLSDDQAARQAELRVIGLGLMACEKSIQIIYEHGLRPPERQHEPWVRRVNAQMLAALQDLNSELVRRPLPCSLTLLTQAGVTTAVTWHFIQRMLPERVPAADFAALAQFSAAAESLPPFLAAPHGEGACAPSGDADLATLALK
jgi:glutathione S-transferase